MSIKRHQKYLNEAFTLSKAVEPVGNARVAAILVRQNRAIAYGFNRNKTNPFAAKFGRNKDCIYLHAETDAIRNALREVDAADLEHMTLYVARSKKTSTHDHTLIPGLAKPCEGCRRAIAQFGIKNVYYTTDDYDENNSIVSNTL